MSCAGCWAFSFPFFDCRHLEMWLLTRWRKSEKLELHIFQGMNTPLSISWWTAPVFSFSLFWLYLSNNLSICCSGALTHSVKALDISLKIDTELALQVGRRTNRAWHHKLELDLPFSCTSTTQLLAVDRMFLCLAWLVRSSFDNMLAALWFLTNNIVKDASTPHDDPVRANTTLTTVYYNWTTIIIAWMPAQLGSWIQQKELSVVARHLNRWLGWWRLLLNGVEEVVCDTTKHLFLRNWEQNKKVYTLVMK